MSSAVWNERQAFARKTGAGVVIPCAIFAGLVCLRLALQYATAGALYLEDDAFYYTVIAHNIAQSGVSTFDGQTLTNGYHPLWLAIMVLQALTLGSSIYITIAIEIVLATAGVWFFLTTFRTQSLLLRSLFALVVAIIARPMIAKGMEVSLLIFALGLFTRVALACRRGEAGPLALGLSAALCIGARIDSAVFVLPMALFAASTVRGVCLAFAPIVVAGILFAGVNQLIFGAPFPISGAVKSLGGLQINWRVLRQIGSEASHPGMFGPVVSFANGLIGRSLVLFGLCAVALAFVPRGAKSRLLLWSYLIGFALFAVKIVFFSSWLVWPWYTFPSIIGAIALFHAVDDLVVARNFAVDARLEYGLAALLVVGAVAQLHGGATRVANNFELVNRKAIADLRTTLNGARIAMGDRAGSFAAFYPGPVTQLEGLVNDREYLDAVQAHRDIKPLLCARGVRFVLSYQKDLGDYKTVDVPVMRTWLTSFAGPILTFSHADEVGRVSDLAKFDSSKDDDEGDNYLYAWRLTGCPNGE